MSTVQIVSIAIAVVAFALITFEERITFRKTPVALIAGVVLWLIAAAQHDGDDTHLLVEANAEIFEIFAFLFSAMVLVEGLDQLHFFDLVRTWLLKLGLQDRKQFLLIGALTFFLSATLDNMTATIVMVEFSRRFFYGRNLLVMAAGIVVFANAGGAWSPIGDVTTIMLWVQQKFSTGEIVLHVFLPSVVHAAVGGGILLRQISNVGIPDEVNDERELALNRTDKLLIAVTLASFALPLVVRQVFGISPYLGLLLGLGIIWAMMDHLHHTAQDLHDQDPATEPTRLQRDIMELLRRVDHHSLLFFVGILLLVSALGQIGVLDEFSDWLLGDDPSDSRIIVGSVVLGYASAIVDNVPLTALAMDVMNTVNPWHWTLLAYTVGTGGSHLVLGSVAGVIAMGKVEGLTTISYVRIAGFAVFVAYLAGLAVWLVEFQLFG